MPTSHAEFGDHTTGHTVVSSYPDSVQDKIILITGANPGGIGGSSAVALGAASPKLLILAGRSQTKLSKTTEDVKKVNPNVACRSLIIDLSSQDSCRKAANQVLEDSSIPQVDLLINNAGVMDIPERTLSPEGIEMQFATNHIGHFLFTNLILPKIEAAAKRTTAGATRIINLSSSAVMYGPIRFPDHNFTKCEAELPEEYHMSKAARSTWNEHEDLPYVPQAAYGQSKTANVAFSVELNKRLFEKTGILSVAVHPGAIMTELGRHISEEKKNATLEGIKKALPHFSMKDLEEGCSTTLVAALDPEITKGDVFIADCQVADWLPDYATNSQKAEQLWKLSEQLVGQQFSP